MFPSRSRLKRVIVLQSPNLKLLERSSFYTGFSFFFLDFYIQILGVALNASAFDIGVFTAAVFAAQIVSHPIAGVLADRVGRSKTLALGGFVRVASLVLVGVAFALASPTIITIGRAIQGLAAGFFWTSSSAAWLTRGVPNPMTTTEFCPTWWRILARPHSSRTQPIREQSPRSLQEARAHSPARCNLWLLTRQSRVPQEWHSRGAVPPSLSGSSDLHLTRRLNDAAVLLDFGHHGRSVISNHGPWRKRGRHRGRSGGGLPGVDHRWDHLAKDGQEGRAHPNGRGRTRCFPYPSRFVGLDRSHRKWR